MILTCPECQTQYAVPDSAIGVDGRRVRCVKCRYEWFQESVRMQDDTAFEDVLNPLNQTEDPGIPDWSSLPALSRKPRPLPWMIGTGVAALFLLFGVMLWAREGLYGAMPGFYHALGYYPVDGLQLANVTIETEEGRRKQRHTIHCLIVNTAKEPRRHPPLAMRIVTGSGNVLAEEDEYLPGSNEMIPAGEKVDCGKIEIVQGFSSAERILLEIASPLERGRRAAWEADLRKKPEKKDSAEEEKDHSKTKTDTKDEHVENSH